MQVLSLRFLALFFSFLLSAERVGAVLVINGDFELPQLTEYQVLNIGDTRLPGWRIEQGVSNYLFQYINASGAGIAQSGNAFIGLARGRLAQSVAGLVPGTQYELEFWTSPFTSNYYYGSSTILVSIGNESDLLVYSGPYPGAETRVPHGDEEHPWTQHVYRFSATSEEMELSFAGGYFGSGGQFGHSLPGIDNVSIRPVPEPSTVMLLLSGLGFCLRLRRRE